jgi:thymidylate synthase (FAD)
MKVELISKTVGVNSYGELNNEEIIAAIARHGTVKEDNGKLVKYLMDHAHWSPLQHISFGFKIETRRSISAQIFRHRSLNGQEWSLRYAEPLGFEKIELRREHPTNRQSSTEEIIFDKEFDTIKLSDAAYGAGSHFYPKDAIDSVLRQIQELYEGLISLGVARECARDILPLCTKTTIHITATLRDLLGFLNVRCDEHAQKEVRDIATAIGEELEKELPNVFSNIDWRKGMFM